MPIKNTQWITRGMLRKHPKVLFVFGDNLARIGYGGQAKEMRGEPNAVGIPTKRYPGMLPRDFLYDRDYNVYIQNTRETFKMLANHLRNGGVVVLPSSGLGTNRAQMEQRSPKIWKQLQRDLETLKKIAQQENTYVESTSKTKDARSSDCIDA